LFAELLLLLESWLLSCHAHRQHYLKQNTSYTQTKSLSTLTSPKQLHTSATYYRGRTDTWEKEEGEKLNHTNLKATDNYIIFV
jgi:hypothetical protein